MRWLTPTGAALLLMAMLVLTTQVWAKPMLSATNAHGPSATPINCQDGLDNPDGSAANEQPFSLAQPPA